MTDTDPYGQPFMSKAGWTRVPGASAAWRNAQGIRLSVDTYGAHWNVTRPDGRTSAHYTLSAAMIAAARP